MTKSTISNQTIKRGILLDPLECSNINFDYVSKNVDFVILKAIGKAENISRGGEIFSDVYNECHNTHNIKTGVYYELFLTSGDLSNTSNITKKVNSLVDNLNNYNLKGRKFEYPIYIGLNEMSYFVSSSYHYKNIIKALNSRLVQTYNKWMGIYVNKSNLNVINNQSLSKKDTIRTDYAFWVSDRSMKYNENEYYMTEDHGDQLGMWEYTDIGRVIGVKTECDMSFCFVDYPTLIKNKKMNGYT